ncbi:hypothetical protein OAL34_00500 [Synechococcus sp. AH-551-G03]|nr:hypothetical protein [Synechococcus sp. AH-551-G03]
MSKSWNDIENHWLRLRDQSSFVLETPCILIDKDGDLFETTLFDLIDFIDVPSTMSREYLKDYLQNAVEFGVEAARSKMLDTYKGNSQKFFEELALIKQLSRNDTLGDIDDILHAMEVANRGFTTAPRKMLIVQMGEYRADLLLVSPPSNDGRKMVASQ